MSKLDNKLKNLFFLSLDFFNEKSGQYTEENIIAYAESVDAVISAIYAELEPNYLIKDNSNSPKELLFEDKTTKEKFSVSFNYRSGTLFMSQFQIDKLIIGLNHTGSHKNFRVITQSDVVSTKSSKYLTMALKRNVFKELHQRLSNDFICCDLNMTA